MKSIDIILLLFMILTLAACQIETTNQKDVYTYVSSDGPARLLINGKEYVSIRDAKDNEYTINKMIGTVQKKVFPNVIMKTNFSSNSLEVGTEIYSVKEDKHVFLAKTSEDTFSLYTIR